MRHFSAAHALSAAAAPVARSAQAERPAQARGQPPEGHPACGRPCCPDRACRAALSLSAKSLCVWMSTERMRPTWEVCRANFFVLLETKHYINTSVRVRAKLSDRPTPPAIIEPRDHRITNIKGCACLTSACCHDWRHGPDGEPPAKPSCSSRPRVLEGSRVESGSPRPPTPRYAPWRVSWGRGMCSSWPSELPRSRTRAYCGRCAADCAQDSEPQKAQAGCKL